MDFAKNTYQFSYCRGFYQDIRDEMDKTEINNRYIYFIIYKTFSSIPFSIFSSFIVISLTYRSIVDIVDYILKYKNRSIPYVAKLFSKSKDSFCCDLFSVDDEHEIIYSKCDIDYVLNLLNSHSDAVAEKNFKKIKKHNYLNESIEKKNFGSKIISIAKRVVSWDPNFKYSSRVVNTLVVSFIVLYYFVLYMSYQLAYYTSYFSSLLPDDVDLKNQNIPVGELVCTISEDLCVDEAFRNYTIKLPVPDKIIQILPWIQSSIFLVFAAQ